MVTATAFIGVIVFAVYPAIADLHVKDRLISFRPASPSKNLDAGGAADWIHSQSALNGLQSTDICPWHIVIAYDQFDEDGDNVHSGIVEEYWAGPKKYRISYRSDTVNQTDYATEQGLFCIGDQRWPNRAEAQVSGVPGLLCTSD